MNSLLLLTLIASCTLTLAYSPFRKNPRGPKTYVDQQWVVGMSKPPTDQFNPFEIIYQWKILDFQYPSLEDRQQALADGSFLPQNNLPLGLDVWKDRIFITTPRWKNGIPASLSWLPLPPSEQSPAMMPYPDWSYHGDPLNPDCDQLMSVYRLQVDECERLWVIDAGVINATIKINQVCPPKVVVFDLKTNKPVFVHEFPADHVLESSLYTNILIDIRNGQCQDAYAYIPDAWRYGLVVVSMKQKRSWRTTNHLYFPTPQACNYNLHGVKFQWTDGIFGMSLSPLNKYQDRILFYNPMSSYGEFMVSTSILRNETIWLTGGLPDAFIQIGSRGSPNGQIATSNIDRKSVMFYNLIQQDSVGCWDTSKPYNRENLGIIARDNNTLVFPNDSKVDHEIEQGLWVLSNRLPFYLYASLDYSQINFRIQRVSADDVVRGTICDPTIPAVPTPPFFDKCFE